MDQNIIERLMRALRAVPSRRGVLSGLTGTCLGFGVGRLPEIADAKRKRKRKKKDKRSNPNAFGCLDVGAACKTAEACCSSICEGKQGKRKCQSHDASGCSAGAQSRECGGTDVPCTTTFLDPGVCGTTTGHAGYCFASSECHPCTTDIECRDVIGGQFGPYAACIRCADCPETGDTACAGPIALPAINAQRRPG